MGLPAFFRGKRDPAPFSILCFFVLFFSACNSPYSPKPKGYFEIDLPEKKYQTFDRPGFPYSFEYPEYATIERDTVFFGEDPENPWWINLNFPKLNATVYISYKEIGAQYTLNRLVNDAHKMTYKNALKADDIVSEAFETVHDVSGLMYSVAGDAATARQFFATDSAHHFLRGSLYFNSVPNADSTQPVVDFLDKDIWHLLETLHWR